MKVLVTGAGGFLGRHLTKALREQKEITLLYYYHDTGEDILFRYLSDCDFIYHLAGVNRPLTEAEFMEGNAEFTGKIIGYLNTRKKNCPVLYASSIHAEGDTPYGISKKTAENMLFDYQNTTGGQVYIYRLTNIFGAGARPNYNSVVATFSYNISHGLPITIHDSHTMITLCYIEDVVEEFLRILHLSNYKTDKFYSIPKMYEISLGTLADMLYSFSRGSKSENIQAEFEKKLYITYNSYIHFEQAESNF